MANPANYKTTHLRAEAREALERICVLMIMRTEKTMTISEAVVEAEKALREKESVNAA